MRNTILFIMMVILLFSGCVLTTKLHVEDTQPQSSIDSETQDEMFERYLRMTEEAGKTWTSYTNFSGTIADTDTFLMLDVSVTPPTGGTVYELPFSELKDDLDNFDEFGFPYGAQPTIDTNAEAAVDTTDGQLIVYLNSDDRVITYKHRQCFTLEDPADADDDIPIFTLDDGFTVTRIDCYVDAGTSAVVVLNDGTDNLDSVTCLTTVTSDTSMSGNNTFTALETMEADIGTVTGTVNWVNVCFTYTITRE